MGPIVTALVTSVAFGLLLVRNPNRAGVTAFDLFAG
jgi:hypothetical protein